LETDATRSFCDSILDMQKLLATMLACTVLTIYLHAQSRVGEQAPVLHFGPVLQGEQKLPRQGDALLIEFWATWCEPCIASIPHLNSLAQQFRSRNLDFLWLSGESMDKVKPFLEHHPMSGTVALDSGSSLWQAFDGRGLPTTVLINSSGKIAAITRAELVDDSVLTSLLDERLLLFRPGCKPCPFKTFMRWV
jgi:thiol-disulfide isomerase/thioredoxin